MAAVESTDAPPALTIAALGETDSSIPDPGPGFEGPEKVLEIDFAPGHGPARGLREISRAHLDELCTDAHCTILNSMSNDHLDSYVLSESSLFVYPLKMIIKTCGTTTLLMVLPRLLEITTAMGMKVEWVAYTRKDFQFPHVQKFPHRDPQEETTYLKRFFPEGSAFIMGPMTGDHWYVYVADYVDRPTTECTDRTLDLMMFGIDEDVARLFVKDAARFPTDADVTKASGIDSLLPGSTIQEFCFEPCGYSMNGLLYDAYWTIHITPESHCSYASFETNIRMKDYGSLVKAVLAIFRPRRVTMTLFSDEHGLRQLRASPLLPLVSVPIVDVASSAVMGPCVLLADGSIGTAEEVSGSAAGGGSGSTPATPRKADDDAAAGCSGSGAGSGAATPGGSGFAPGASGLSASMRRVGSSSSLGGPVGRRAAANFVQTHKSMSEFLGYSCQMANYTAVHSPPGASPRAAMSSVGEAARDALSMPRAKYIVAARAEEIRGRVRAESL